SMNSRRETRGSEIWVPCGGPRQRRSRTMLRVSVALVVLLASGWSSSRAVRLEPGPGRTWEYAPRTWNRSVEVDRQAFEEALTQLVLAEPFSLRPSETARMVRISLL